MEDAEQLWESVDDGDFKQISDHIKAKRDQQSESESEGDDEENDSSAASSESDYDGGSSDAAESESYSEGDDSETESEELSNRAAPSIIYDPVMTKGGFKIMPQYHNTEIFENEDLADRIENGLYSDYIHKGAKKFRDILDLALLSRADIDLIGKLFLPSSYPHNLNFHHELVINGNQHIGLSEKQKRTLMLDERLQTATEKDAEFGWDLKEKF